MPERKSYACEVCGRSVDDTDLEADQTGTLRRMVINAQVFKAVTTQVPDVDGTSTIPSVSIAENNSGNAVIFCGQAHAALYVTNWVW